MKILLAADGSSYTKKALGWLLANQLTEDDELIVINVQGALPPRVRTAVGADMVKSYYESETTKILAPIERFMRRHKVPFRTLWFTGQPAQEIVRVANREKVHMICMGTHGRGMLGRAIMGSVAQGVVAEAKVPVMLVK